MKTFASVLVAGLMLSSVSFAEETAAPAAGNPATNAPAEHMEKAAEHNEKAAEHHKKAEMHHKKATEHHNAAKKAMKKAH